MKGVNETEFKRVITSEEIKLINNNNHI